MWTERPCWSTQLGVASVADVADGDAARCAQVFLGTVIGTG